MASWLLGFITSETFNAGFATAISLSRDPLVASILEGVHCQGLWGCVLAGTRWVGADWGTGLRSLGSGH